MMRTEAVVSLLNEIVSLKNRYDRLHLKFQNGKAYLVGDIEFTAKREQDEVTDCYQVEVYIPEEYPLLPPTVKEVGGRIYRDVNHHVYPDDTLCLGPPIKVFMTFKKNPTLLGYVDNLLVPKLFWHSYNMVHTDRPLEAYAHNDEGIREYREESDLAAVYFEILGVNNVAVVLHFLKFLCSEVYDEKQACPCGKGKILRDCHGNTLKSLTQMPYLKTTHLAQDYWHLKEQYKTGRARH